MLSRGRVATRLPVQDLKRARAFYADKLGLHPVEEREGGLRYACDGLIQRRAHQLGARVAGGFAQILQRNRQSEELAK